MNYISYLAVGAVAVVLVLGLLNMMIRPSSRI